MYKITFLFCCLLLCFFQTEASNSQELPPITIRFNNQPLDSALSQLDKVSRYEFVFQDSIVNKSHKINQNFKNKTVNQILDALLVSSDYSYFNFGRWIVVYKKKDNLMTTAENKELETFSITGTVVDKNGKPLLGASIRIKRQDTNTAEEGFTFTDYDGNFTILVTNPNAYIIVLCINYIPSVVHIQNAGLIKLELDHKLFDEVITIGQAVYLDNED